MARAAVPPVATSTAGTTSRPRPLPSPSPSRSSAALGDGEHLLFATAGAVYIAALLAVDHYASYPQQLVLGALTCSC